MTKTKRLFEFANIRLLAMVFFLLITMVACNDDEPAPAPLEPTIDEVEIGSGNNGIGVIGRDFHFNVEIVAGDKIDSIAIRIQQRADEVYTSDWEFEMSWNQHHSAKNTTLHEHFDISEDAVEGKYDFIIIVTDENGTRLKEVYDVELVDPANLPVNPKLYLWSVENSNEDRMYFINETLKNPENVMFANNDTLTSNLQVQNVKDDGVMYILLIKKDLNHRPETASSIDFSKAIVLDVYEHKNEEEVFTFWNTPYDSEIYDYIRWPELIIGASNDNNAPLANPISGEKAWQNGLYYLGVVYTNTTHQLSVHHYFELTLEGF